MKRLLLAAALAVASVIGIGALADATQNRPDSRPDPDSASTITFQVDTQRYPRNADPGAALWLACQGTFRNHTMELTETSDGAYRAIVQPALGHNAQRRLTGCLNDVTVDRLTGHDVAIDTAATLAAIPTVDAEPVGVAGAPAELAP